MQENQAFRESRSLLLEQMNVVMDSWDGSSENGPDIISHMKPLIENLQQIQKQEIPFSQVEEKKLREIYRKETRLITVMEVAKEEIAKELRGMNKKKAMVRNYVYPNNPPTFVNQEL